LSVALHYSYMPLESIEQLTR